MHCGQRCNRLDPIFMVRPFALLKDQEAQTLAKPGSSAGQSRQVGETEGQEGKESCADQDAVVGRCGRQRRRFNRCLAADDADEPEDDAAESKAESKGESKAEKKSDKPACQFGSKCFRQAVCSIFPRIHVACGVCCRKNPQHLLDFYHPPRDGAPTASADATAVHPCRRKECGKPCGLLVRELLPSSTEFKRVAALLTATNVHGYAMPPIQRIKHVAHEKLDAALAASPGADSVSQLWHGTHCTCPIAWCACVQHDCACRWCDHCHPSRRVFAAQPQGNRACVRHESVSSLRACCVVRHVRCRAVFCERLQQKVR